MGPEIRLPALAKVEGTPPKRGGKWSAASQIQLPAGG